MPNNFYLGNASDLASNIGSIFGQNNVTGSSLGPPLKPSLPGGPQDVGLGPISSITGSSSGIGSAYDPYAAQAVRPTTFGNFDPSYAQDLATYIGNIFQRPQSNQPLQFNPFGNLTDANVPYGQLGGGTAPGAGLPQTLLGTAQGVAQAAQPPAVTPAPAPVKKKISIFDPSTWPQNGG